MMKPDPKLKPLTSTRVSRCLYCNATSYGKGCRYAPYGVHFHPDDPKKCSYCGSTNYGRGCQINPTSNVHLHGINFNTMFKETVTPTIEKTFILEQLNKPYTEYTAYKLGIIDIQGNKIKEPITEEEKLSYTPLVKTYLKLKKYLGPKLELINQTSLLENTSKINYNRENHKNILEFESKVEAIYEQIHEATQDALNNGLTLEQVTAILQK